MTWLALSKCMAEVEPPSLLVATAALAGATEEPKNIPMGVAVSRFTSL